MLKWLWLTGLVIGLDQLTKRMAEAALANNTVANGYVELLVDLVCVSRSYAWDASRSVRLPRKPCKYHFINTLAAVACDPKNPRTVGDFKNQAPKDQGRWWEWLVAQELWRRSAIRGDPVPEDMSFWQSEKNELDFVVGQDQFIEVKRGRTSPLEFTWFPRVFPGGRLIVLSASAFQTDHVKGITMEQFLLQDA